MKFLNRMSDFLLKLFHMRKACIYAFCMPCYWFMRFSYKFHIKNLKSIQNDKPKKKKKVGTKPCKWDGKAILAAFHIFYLQLVIEKLFTKKNYEKIILFDFWVSLFCFWGLQKINITLLNFWWLSFENKILIFCSNNSTSHINDISPKELFFTIYAHWIL